ncbi:MAG: branched-chain amino acid ABC transporter permease [Streptosporangiales bacterium]|nr:branched-chain amino acid ABC transporter permease [Streptosporangiales bacterium]
MRRLTSMSLTAKVKLILLAAAIVAGVALPYVLSPFLVSVVSLALVFGLFAMSIDLLAGFAGLVSVGHAGILATAAYGVGYVATHGGGYVAQILAGLGVGLVASIVFALMAMRTSRVYFLLITLAQGMIVWGLSIRLYSITGAENGLRDILRPSAVSAYWKYYYLCLAVLFVCGGLMWVIVRSPFGYGLRGLRDSEERVRMLGYNTTLHKFYAFVLSGFFASISGVLFVYQNEYISPAAAEFLVSGTGVLMVVLGGVGTLVGPVIGAFIITLIENELSAYVERWPTVLGAVFIITILFAPNGLVGGLSRLWRRWTGPRGRGEPETATAEEAAETEPAGRSAPSHQISTGGGK